METTLLVVIFCGPDGAGKTTQVKLLTEYFKSRGYKTSRSWIRALHSLAFIISEFLVARGYFRIVSNPVGGGHKVFDLSRIPKLRRAWPLVEFVSTIPLIITRVIIPSLLGRIVVSERYTIDSIISISYLVDNHDFQKSRLASIMLALIPKDSCFIYLDSDYNEILKRRGVDSEPEDFIRIQREMCDDFSIKFQFLKIDTTLHSIEETHLMIRARAESELSKGRKLTSSLSLHPKRNDRKMKDAGAQI